MSNILPMSSTMIIRPYYQLLTRFEVLFSKTKPEEQRLHCIAPHLDTVSTPEAGCPQMHSLYAAPCMYKQLSFRILQNTAFE